MTLNRSQAAYCLNQAKMLIKEAQALDSAAEPLRVKYLQLHARAEAARQKAADLERTAHMLQKLALTPPRGCPNSDKPQRKQQKRVFTKQEAIQAALAFIKQHKQQ